MLPFEDESPESCLSSKAIRWESFEPKSIKPGLGTVVEVGEEIAEKGDSGPGRTKKTSRSQSTGRSM